MKKIGLLIALTVLASCSKPAATKKESPPPEVAGTPAPASPPPVAEAPPAPEIAPAGTFFLLTPASVETSHGVRDLPPGTGVQLVRPGIYRTPLGEGPIADAQLTNDILIAREARDASYTPMMTLAPRALPDPTAERERAISTLVAEVAIPVPEASPATATPSPKPSDSVATPTPSPTPNHPASPVEIKRERGVVWQKSADGQSWEPLRYFSGLRKNLPPPHPVK